MTTLASCQSGAPLDCSVVAKQASDCMQKFEGRPEREMLLACFPFSQPETIEGAWYFGFELNAFYEDQTAPKAFRSLPGPVVTSLDYDPKLPNDESVRIFQMKLIGRRSICPMGLPGKIILVDGVTSKVATATGRE